MANDDSTAKAPTPERTLPEIRESTSLKDTFHQLAEEQTRGFYLVRQGRRTHVVKADMLADVLLQAEPNDRIRNADTTLGELMTREILERTTVPVVREAEIDLKPLLQTSPLIFFCANPVTPHENLEWGDGYCGRCPWHLKKKE